jgi:hypothetical protein
VAKTTKTQAISAFIDVIDSRPVDEGLADTIEAAGHRRGTQEVIR